MRQLATVVLIAMCATAAADPKPTIAIMAIDPKGIEAAELANTLTTAMRGLAAKSGRFRAKGTQRELVDAYAKLDCEAVKPACAAAIGAAVGVDFVMTGELEPRGDHPVLSLALVNVSSRTRVRSLRESVSKSVDPRRWAAKAYDRMVGVSAGELIIVANAQRGEIWLDGELVAALFDGRATLSDIALGSHKLSIRASGFRPFDVDITVDGSTRQNLLLEPAQ
jgi:hypothetical protein